jgi:hypothetical protein
MVIVTFGWLVAPVRRMWPPSVRLDCYPDAIGSTGTTVARRNDAETARHKVEYRLEVEAVPVYPAKDNISPHRCEPFYSLSNINLSHFKMAEENRKVALLTGITGQDGSYLAEFLLEKGYTVSCLSESMPRWSFFIFLIHL